MTTSVPSHFRRIAYTAAVFTIVLPIGILLSWLESPTSLPGLPSDFHTIKPNTALATLLCGLALLLQIQEPMAPLRRRLAQICATLACLITGGNPLGIFLPGLDRRSPSTALTAGHRSRVITLADGSSYGLCHSDAGNFPSPHGSHLSRRTSRDSVWRFNGGNDRQCRTGRVSV